MALVKGYNLPGFIALNGRLGRPNGAGLMKAGWSKAGEWFPEAGIFRRDGRWHTQRIVKMTHYRPTNNQMENQQIWRGTFRDGVTAFHSLSPSEVLEYKRKGARVGLTGFNYYMSRYLRNLL